MKEFLCIYGNSIHQAYARMIMLLLGIDVDYVFNLESARQKIESNAYRVILIDVDALGLEGFDLAREIRKSDPMVPIIGITGIADLNIMYKSIENGMNNCIQRTELLETLTFYKDKMHQKEVA